VSQLVQLPVESRVLEFTLGAWLPAMASPTSHGVGSFGADWTLRLDALSAVMILMVTFVGSLIHIYATAYMDHEAPGPYARFFTYLNLFCFFMLTLVLAANFFVLFVGWEGVGLCSYLLIGYWYHKDSAANAGRKAFIVNRIGDWGFLLGVLLVFTTTGSVDFYAVRAAVEHLPVETAAFATLSVACLLLFVGATGKSAQIPLFVWLPDAMEGPTPVSALIHAATMVTAGVYLLCRNAMLFSHAPMVLEIVATVGALTALVAACIGLVQTDIKRVLAYSTVSQLGYMFLAAGVGAYGAAMFHLITHAFFKALLFLGSGSVIHGMSGEQDMRHMGGLRAFLPITAATMTIGSLAIAGIPPFAGFFSKDEILAQAFANNRPLWVLGVITAAMTAFYTWRLVALTFLGARREAAPAVHGGHGHGDHGHHAPHESPVAMTGPLVVLAIGATLVGFFGLPAVWGGSTFEHFIEPVISTGAHGGGHGEGGHLTEAAEYALMIFSVVVAATGIWLAQRMFVQTPAIAVSMAARFSTAHRWLTDKLYIDELYGATVVAGTYAVSRISFWFDRTVVDGIVNGSATVTLFSSWLSGLIDRRGVDGVVNGVGNTLHDASFGFRRMHTGLTQNYALAMVLGVVVFVGVYLVVR
jgi:NADH-quinone oxidoreductase subunit L